VFKALSFKQFLKPDFFMLYLLQEIPLPTEGYLVILLVILAICLISFLGFENWYSSYYDKPLYRNFLVYKKLAPSQIALLKTEFPFYNSLTKELQGQFQHRVATFIKNKEFVARESLEITQENKTLIAAMACKLSFGRKNYTYTIMDYILVYPGVFYSNTNDAHHKGEFNPRQKSLVLSWEDFEKGYRIGNDNYNLGLHEFMHAMHLEAKVGRDIDSARFMKHFNLILQRLADEDLKKTLDETRFFRAYAFTNQYEFMAVLTEYYFESPKELKELFPEVYQHINAMLNLGFVFNLEKRSSRSIETEK
jgi:Mlc titration factor MtfA (ptsG expression regulator)